MESRQMFPHEREHGGAHDMPVLWQDVWPQSSCLDVQVMQKQPEQNCDKHR